MNGTDPIKRAWAESVPDPALPGLEAARTGADKLYQALRRRNLAEYAACLVVILCFGRFALTLPSPMARIGAALVVTGTLFVAWQLHRRASAVRPPESALAEPILTFQRAQLVRQRDALAGVFGWYLLPLIPGMLVMSLGGQLDRGLIGLRHMPPHLILALLVQASVFGGVWLLNQRGARKLQARIDQIDAVMIEK